MKNETSRIDPVANMRRAINCLAIEIDESIVADIRTKFEAVVADHKEDMHEAYCDGFRNGHRACSDGI